MMNCGNPETASTTLTVDTDQERPEGCPRATLAFLIPLFIPDGRSVGSIVSISDTVTATHQRSTHSPAAYSYNRRTAQTRAPQRNMKWLDPSYLCGVLEVRSPQVLPLELSLCVTLLNRSLCIVVSRMIDH